MAPRNTPNANPIYDISVLCNLAFKYKKKKNLTFNQKYMSTEPTQNSATATLDARRRDRETDNHNNEDKDKILDNELLPPTISTTRKGSAFPMRHPADVKLHSNDFNFEDYHAKKIAEKSNNNDTVAATPSESAASATAAKEKAKELTGDDAQHHLDRQGEAWELHYRHTQNNFFPIKNYLAQAFRSVILPLLPPIVSPEGCNDLEDAAEGEVSVKQNNDDDNDDNVETKLKETTTSETNSCTEDVSPNPIKPAFIIECGCGTGSALLPLMLAAGGIHRYAGFDISSTAVELFKKHEIVRKLTLEASQKNSQGDGNEAAPPALFVLDAAEQEIPQDLIPPNSADICLLIFVLSAIERSKMPLCLKRLAGVMKPGAHLCFRDFGILDNSFFRFEKNGNKTCRGSFVKGDQTQQYFFSMEEVKELFGECGFEVVDLTYHCNKLTNRKTGVEMHKIIVNGLFKKK